MTAITAEGHHHMANPNHTFIPASGWYFTHPNEDNAEHPRTFYRVALWRIDYDGTTHGLISVVEPGTPTELPRLHAPPAAAGGQYVHVDDLTDEDRAAITALRFT